MMENKGRHQWVGKVLSAWRKMPTQKEQGQFKSSPNNNVAEEALYILNKLKSDQDVWQSFCKATDKGKPKCLPEVVGIALAAELIEAEDERTPTHRHSIKIYSEHHEAILEINSNPEDSLCLSTIVWALEGMRFKR